MVTICLLSAICNALTLICDIFILTHPHLSIKKYIILFLSLSAFYFVQLYSNNSSLLLFVTLTVNSALLALFTKKFYSGFYIPLSFILDCILLNFIAFAAIRIWDLSINTFESARISIVIFSICTVMASCPILYLMRRFLEKYLINIFEKADKKLLTLITLTILLCSFLVRMTATFFDTQEISYKEFLLVFSLYVLFFLFTISMVLIVLYTTRKNYEAQRKVAYLENLKDYTNNLEMVYNNLRSFRHDYINIMASLAAYIDEKKYEELAVFFHENILPMQKNLTQKNAALNNLLHVNLLELKSILYTKLLLAVNQDIDVNIDIPDEIDSVHMDPVDLTRMLGIYLDNAIEACLETEHPTINFHLGKMNRDVVFIISNTFINKGLSIAQMYKKEVTTKGKGHGIGLFNVSEILNRYDNIYHETLIEDSLFIQQIQIS